MIDVEVQTMYREQETQTDPYSPEYVIAEGENEEPEVIRLQKMGLSYGMIL